MSAYAAYPYGVPAAFLAYAFGGAFITLAFGLQRHMRPLREDDLRGCPMGCAESGQYDDRRPVAGRRSSEALSD